jgi:hypothetical protein
MKAMTDTIKAGEMAVLKQDGLGRVKTPAGRREQLLDEFERSGLSGTKFAALAGVKYQTFAFWVQQRRRQQRGSAPVAAKAVDSVRWLEAVVEGAKNPGGQNPAAIVLHLPGGARVEVADEKQALLAAVMILALAGPC